MLIASDDLFYATPNLDRAAHLRLDSNWLNKEITNSSSRFILLHQSKNLFKKTLKENLPHFLNPDESTPFLKSCPWAYLGSHQGKSLFVIDASEITETEITQKLEPDLFFEDLRRAGPIMQKDQASQFAYGRALMFWHSRHQFCGACGHKTALKQAGHMRTCLNPDCGIPHFPRTDPAVIMLVHDGTRCLLAHNHYLRDGMYSTLAGFVEPGETLEQAVRREVMEETNIQVGDVTFAGSQPWPFPTSLMIGFYAHAQSYDITLQDEELEDAQWFSRDDLRKFKAQGRLLPSRDSIARNMIEAWIKAE
ncbi:NUDIX hydrolase [Candidatus Terasakiella magnetica]|uniref:NAD(+) diphosphatase n=1 Tax=Candidatus Terasakiella magnetica TaxID=1867952 RepID=A0A1C3RIR6_9PROT|nr:NAD(+) diphosphatase [Candidatus Terasakiella magnetica]SCA57162.1 NUDIX hydrolase [Candidatus Terasakiella magnetica]